MAAAAASLASVAAAAGMTADELAGQRIVYALPGTRAPAPLLRRIHSGEAAGVILFARNIRSRGQVRTLARTLQRARPRGAAPLIVAIDQEGGLVTRLAGAPALSPAQIGRTGSARVARREGLATARNLLGAGVNVDLAPVLDVGRRGGNIRSLGRSFSASASGVVRLAGAFAAGLARGGVAPTGKHFPGLGAARGDQDRTLNRIRLSRSRLRAIDERPYRRLGPGLPLVMVGSAIYPALDAQRPALFSRRVATGELRAVAGYKGASISDDLEVPALARHGSAGARAVRSARAGVDLLLFAETFRGGAAAQRALARAIASGAVDRGESERSVARALALRGMLRRP